MSYVHVLLWLLCNCAMQQPGHGVGASAARISAVLALYGTMRDRLLDAAQSWSDRISQPVSDAPLRRFCNLSRDRRLPEAPETLMLGAHPLLQSLDS